MSGASVLHFFRNSAMLGKTVEAGDQWSPLRTKDPAKAEDDWISASPKKEKARRRACGGRFLREKEEKMKNTNRFQKVLLPVLRCSEAPTSSVPLEYRKCGV